MNRSKVLYRIPYCTNCPGARALGKGSHCRSGACRELGRQGPGFSQRGFNEREAERGGGSRRPGCPSLRAAVAQVNPGGVTSKGPHLNNHRYFEDAGMKGLGRHNYPRCHSPRGLQEPSYCLQ